MKKTKVDLARNWIIKAKSDLADAQRTIQSEGPYDTACFHCQQTAEKCLKAFLSWNEKEIPKTHDIEELMILCHQANSTFVVEGLNPEQLSSYAVDMRYDAEFWPDLNTAKDALKQAESVLATMLGHLPPSVMGS